MQKDIAGNFEHIGAFRVIYPGNRDGPLCATHREAERILKHC